MSNIINGYDFITDGSSGDLYAVNKETGETHNAITLSVPEGTTFFTPKQKEEYIAKKNAEQKRLFMRYAHPETERFYFVKYLRQFKDMRPETLVRLLYLMTYADYTQKGCKLMRTRRTQMRLSDLPHVLGVSKPTAQTFFAEVSPQYIQDTESGLVWITDSAFHRGKITEIELDYFRVYLDSMRKLYQSVIHGGMRYVGYIFLMLPYVNREYNILCWNPDETDAQRIERMNLHDICELLGYGTKNIERFYHAISKPTFKCNGIEAKFFRLMLQPGSTDFSIADIYVNPYLIFAGSDPEKVSHMQCIARK